MPLWQRFEVQEVLHVEGPWRAYMKRLAGLILLLACSICWGATRDLYMDPSGSGTDCSTTAADKACSNFEKVVLALNTAPATDGDAVHVHMATGDYTQPAYTYGLD